jgi:hypothetical protein
MDIENLIDLKTAIKLLPRCNGKRIHRSTIQRWIDKGYLTTHKVGGRRYTSVSDLQSMIDCGRTSINHLRGGNINQPLRAMGGVGAMPKSVQAELQRQKIVAQQRIEKIKRQSS